MKAKNRNSESFSRRSFIGTTAAALTAAAVPLNFAMANPATKKDNPNSNFGGVHIGAITYSWRTMPGGLENIVKYCKECNISSIELMSGDLETFLGAPESPMMEIYMEMRRKAAEEAEGEDVPQPRRRGRPAFTPEQQARIDKYNEEVREFRLNVDMKKVEAAKKLLDDAGIKPHIVKFSPSQWSDEEIEYAFKVAKAMGAKGVSEEISEAAANKLGPIAEKHDMYAVFHQHMQFAEVDGFSYDNFVGISPAVMFNFDSGHYFGSTGKNPCDILRKYHDRIFSIHIKDKTGPETDPPNQNQVWGQGEMPLEDVLLLIKKEKWPIYCDIELEYEVKPWSNAVKEVKTCVNYARQILM